MPERRVHASVERVARAPIETTFDTILLIDLASVSRRKGILPAVVGVRDEPEGWGTTGQSRVLLLSDRSRMTETLTHVERPDRFGYRLDGLTGPLRALVRDVRGSWELFGDEAAGTTTVRWTFAFAPRRFARPLVDVVARMWPGYAGPMLDRAVRAVEQRAVETGGPTGSVQPAAS